MHDGKDPHWHHFECFFEKHQPASVGLIENMDNLTWEDQERIRSKIGSRKKALISILTRNITSWNPYVLCFFKGFTSNGTPGKAKASTTKSALKEFAVESAKSARSACVACEQKIEFKEIRISKLDHASETAAMIGGAGVVS